MKKWHIQLVVFLLFISLSQACSTAREPAGSLPSEQTATPSPIPSITPASASPTPTSPPPPSATPQPSPTLPLPPTYTPASFLPVDLVAINPQNAPHLKRLASLPENGASVVAFSPDSRRLAAGYFITNQVILWDLASGQEQLSLSGHVEPRIISYLAFSSDGSWLASAAQGWDAPKDSLILWDANTGRELKRYSGVLGAVSPDFKQVALTQRETGKAVTLLLSDLSTGEELHALEAPSDIYGISFSPDGRQVAAKMFGVFQDLFSFWSVDTGRMDRTLYDWFGFSYSPDGRFIAALLDTGSGENWGELNIFDAASFKWTKTLAKNADSLWYTFPAFSPDGQVLAASTGDDITIWETGSWKQIASLPISDPTGLAFSPDGRILTTFTHSGMVEFWGFTGNQ